MTSNSIEKLLRSSFTEDAVYFYSREEEDINSHAEQLLKGVESDNSLWFLHSSDEDNRFVKLGDFIPPNWKTRGTARNFHPEAA